MGCEGQGLLERRAEGVHDVERQHEVSIDKKLALQENDLETLLEQAGKGFPQLDCLESKPLVSNAPACSGKRVC